MNNREFKQDAVDIIKGKKNEMYSFIVFTLVVIVLLGAFAVRPMVQTVLKINSEIKTRRTTNTQLDTKIKNITTLGKEFVKIEGGLEDLKLIFPSTGDFSLLTANMEELCKKNNFKLLSIGFTESEDESTDMNLSELKSWSANIVVKGRRSGVIQLLQDIEQMPMYPIIQRLSYRNEPDDDGLITFSFAIKVFYIDKSDFFN